LKDSHWFADFEEEMPVFVVEEEEVIEFGV
jgi:hypothetical protein